MASKMFKNEFFECPSYVWGSIVVGIYVAAMIFVLSMLDSILGTKKEVTLTFGGNPVLDADGNEQTVMRGQFAAFGRGIGGMINIAWFFYVLYRFFNRSPNCVRSKFPKSQWRSPFSTAGPV